MNTVFIQVLQCGLAACLLILLVIVLRAGLRRVPKKLICLLWAIVAVRLLLPASLPVKLLPWPDLSGGRILEAAGLINESEIQSTSEQQRSSESQSAISSQNALSSTQESDSEASLNPTALPGVNASFGSETISGSGGLPGSSNTSGFQDEQIYDQGGQQPAGEDDTEQPDPGPLQSGPQGTAVRSNLIRIPAVIWAAGILVMILSGLTRSLKLRARLAESAPLSDSISLSGSVPCSESKPLSGSDPDAVRVRISDQIEMSFVFGLFCPTIYIPASLEASQLPDVLAHEKAHLARRDFLWKPLGYLILCIYWFHPLVWAAWVLFCRDIELACDERVALSMSAAQRKSYAQTLMNCSRKHGGFLMNPVAFGGPDVKKRITLIRQARRSVPWTAAGILLLLLIAAVGCQTAVTPAKASGTVSEAASGNAPAEVSGNVSESTSVSEFDRIAVQCLGKTADEAKALFPEGSTDYTRTDEGDGYSVFTSGKAKAVLNGQEGQIFFCCDPDNVIYKVIWHCDFSQSKRGTAFELACQWTAAYDRSDEAEPLRVPLKDFRGKYKDGDAFLEMLRFRTMYDAGTFWKCGEDLYRRLSFSAFAAGAFLEVWYGDIGVTYGAAGPESEALSVDQMASKAKGTTKASFLEYFSDDETVGAVYSENQQAYVLDHSITFCGKRTDQILVTFGSEDRWAGTEYLFRFDGRQHPVSMAFTYLQTADEAIRTLFGAVPRDQDYFDSIASYEQLTEHPLSWHLYAAEAGNTYVVGDNLRIDVRGTFAISGEAAVYVTIWDGAYDAYNNTEEALTDPIPAFIRCYGREIRLLEEVWKMRLSEPDWDQAEIPWLGHTVTAYASTTLQPVYGQPAKMEVMRLEGNLGGLRLTWTFDDMEEAEAFTDARRAEYDAAYVSGYSEAAGVTAGEGAVPETGEWLLSIQLNVWMRCSDQTGIPTVMIWVGPTMNPADNAKVFAGTDEEIPYRIQDILSRLPDTFDRAKEWTDLVAEGHDGIIYHREVWDSFYEKVQKGQAAEVIIAHVTTEGDPVYYYIEYNGTTSAGAFLCVYDSSRDAFGGGIRYITGVFSRVRIREGESFDWYELTNSPESAPGNGQDDQSESAGDQAWTVFWDVHEDEL